MFARTSLFLCTVGNYSYNMLIINVPLKISSCKLRLLGGRWGSVGYRASSFYAIHRNSTPVPFCASS